MNIITCPHCNEFILIEELNCRIFRHGVFKNTNQQISPHASKEECDAYIVQDLIYGCGKPFKITDKVEKCDYI